MEQFIDKNGRAIGVGDMLEWTSQDGGRVTARVTRVGRIDEFGITVVDIAVLSRNSVVLAAHERITSSLTAKTPAGDVVSRPRRE